MACCHQHNHQPSPNSCSNRCYPPAPPLDPLLLQSIVSLLLHHYPTPSAAAFPGSARSPLDLHTCCSEHSEHQNRKDFPPPHQPSEHLSQAKCPVHSSLLQRIDLLESSFQRFSSAPSPDTASTLRDLAARRIQARFRAFLVRRSRAFRRLKELTSVNSTLDALKSLDSSSVSREAGRREIIQDGDKMTRDNKRSILRAFAEFVEQVEGICVRGNEVSSKTIKDTRPVQNDEKSQVSCARRENEGVGHGGKGSKHCNLDKDEKRLIDNLGERLERIHEISEAVEDVVECRHCRGADRHNRLQSNAKKRVRFLEDENATRVYLNDEISKESINAKKTKDKVEKQQDDRKVESDGEENPAGSVEGSEDEVETENENEDYEDHDETENEGSEGEYETENEVCEDEDEDEDATENEGSEYEDETADEDCEDEDETEEEGSEIEDETGNGSHNGIPQGNQDNRGVVGTASTKVAPVEQRMVHRHEENSKIFSYAELQANAQLIRQQLGEKNMEETHYGKGSASHRRHLRNVLCHNCFKRGHMKRDCWYNPTRLCKKCLVTGHAKEVCGIVSEQQSRLVAQIVN